MYLNASEVWSAVADVVWGDGGKLDEQRCVSGSSTAEQQAASVSGSTKPTGSKGVGCGRGAGAGAAGDGAAGVWDYGAALDGFRGGVDISASSGGGDGITGAVFMWAWRFFLHWGIGLVAYSGVDLFDTRILVERVMGRSGGDTPSFGFVV